MPPSQHPNLAIDLLLNRHSTPAKYLSEPAPQGEALELILRAAMSAPDHAGLQPWRLMLVQGAALQRMGDLFAKSFQQRNPQAAQELVERERSKPTRSPLLILLIAKPQPHPKVPEWEQTMSLGAAATQMHLMAQALGFGCIWLSGERCQDRGLLEQIGLSECERLYGYLALGTPTESCARKVRNNPWDVTCEWMA